MALVGAVDPSTDPFQGLTGYKRDINGRPTAINGQKPAFRGRPNKPGSEVKAPPIRSSSNKPDRKSNITVPYMRTVPVDELHDAGRMSPGDVVFVSAGPRTYTQAGKKANNKVVWQERKEKPTDDAKNIATKKPDDWSIPAPVALSLIDDKSYSKYTKKELIDLGMPELNPGDWWQYGARRFFVVKSVGGGSNEGYGPYVPDCFGAVSMPMPAYSSNTPNGYMMKVVGLDWINRWLGNGRGKLVDPSRLTTRNVLVGSDRVGDEWRLVPFLQEWVVDGVVQSNDQPHSYHGSGHESRQAVDFNIIIQGPAPVNNGYGAPVCGRSATQKRSGSYLSF